MSSSQLPEALRCARMRSVDTMNIETSVHDHIAINNSSATFRFERKGILDPGSAIVIGGTVAEEVVKGGTNSGEGPFYPIRSGIWALLKRATLRIGTNAIAVCDEAGHYQTLMRQFKTVEERTGKDLITKGCLDGMEGENNGNDGYQCKNVEWTYPNVAAGTTTDMRTGRVPQFIQPTAEDSTTPLFSIKLSELFPFMYNTTLPLFLIHEDVSVELIFQSQSGVGESHSGYITCIDHSGDQSNNSMDYKVNETDCKLLCNYLTYNDDRMQKLYAQVMSSEGLIYPYLDQILTVATLPASTGNVVANREIGLAGQTIHSIVCAETPTGASNDPAAHGHAAVSSNLLGRYNSPAPQIAPSTNWRVNDKLVYNRAISRMAQQANQISKVYRTDPVMLATEYSYDPLTSKQTTGTAVKGEINSHAISSATIQGVSQQVMEGQQHFTGLDLSVGGQGVQIGQKPVIQEREMERLAQDDAKAPHEGEPMTQRYWATVERTMRLQGGNVRLTSA